MPATYRIDLANRVVWSHAWGTPGDQELAAHIRELRTDPRFEPDFRQYWDLTEVTTVRVTPDGLGVAARLNPFGAGSRRALVVSTDAYYGLGRMYELLCGDSSDAIGVFREKGAALEWLGLPATWEPPPATPTDPIFDTDLP